MPLPIAPKHIHRFGRVRREVQIADRVNIHGDSIADFSQKGKIFPRNFQNEEGRRRKYYFLFTRVFALHIPSPLHNAFNSVSFLR